MCADDHKSVITGGGKITPLPTALHLHHIAILDATPRVDGRAEEVVNISEGWIDRF